jgi:hypothetical protein
VKVGICYGLGCLVSEHLPISESLPHHVSPVGGRILLSTAQAKGEISFPFPGQHGQSEGAVKVGQPEWYPIRVFRTGSQRE